MLRWVYLLRNLTRNPLRSLLTCLAVAMPIIIYVLSMAVIDGIDRFLDNSVKQLRLVVIHKASYVNPLPAGYRRKIESLDPDGTRILSVCGINFLGGRVGDDPSPLSTLAADDDTFAQTFPEYELTPDELAAWERDRQAILIGSAVAEQYDWKVGDRITITPTLPPFVPMEFHIIATTARANDPVTNFTRMDYYRAKLEEEYNIENAETSFFFVKCATPADLEHFRLAIDELFANSPDPTKTQDEKSFMNEFITQQFDLRTNLSILAAVTVFVAIMAAANTMSMNFRDRTTELATLKAMGFSGRLVFGLVQTESLALCALGGLMGVLIPYVAFTHTPLSSYKVPIIQKLTIEPVVCANGLLISLGIGLLAAVWPSILALRLNVIQAFRNLE
ncbi:MAG: ABC transporter permease [Phycisphaerae bacterium]|nr:ABC transporter permease [Phycisphaerae bacterium]